MICNAEPEAILYCKHCGKPIYFSNSLGFYLHEQETYPDGKNPVARQHYCTIDEALSVHPNPQYAEPEEAPKTEKIFIIPPENKETIMAERDYYEIVILSLDEKGEYQSVLFAEGGVFYGKKDAEQSSIIKHADELRGKKFEVRIRPF